MVREINIRRNILEKEKRVELLQEIVQMKSINGDERPLAEFFQNLFEKAGIEVKIHKHEEENRASLVAEYSSGTEGDILALTGHFDVVDVDDPDEWSYDPFSGEIADGKLYGRGAADMKSGLLGLALAMIELKEEGFEFDGSLRFIGTAGEEIGMLGSQAMTEKGYTDDISAIIVGEPVNSGEINTSHKGSLNYDIIATGSAAHSSTPDEGVNAIMLLIQAVEAIQPKMAKVREEYSNETLGETFNSFTVVEGGTQANSIPETAKITANARTIPEFSNEKIIELLEETIKDLNEKLDEGELGLDVTQNSIPVITDDESSLVKSFLEVLGDDYKVTSFSAVTDASNFTDVDNDFDMVIYGPGLLEKAHALDEYVEVEAYNDYVDDIKEIIKKYYGQ